MTKWELNERTISYWSIFCVIAAIVSLLVYGGFLSAVAILVGGLLWSKPHQDAAARGKRVLGPQMRVTIGALAAALPLALLPGCNSGTTPAPPTASTTQPPVASVQAPVASMQAKTGRSNLLSEQQRKVKLARLLAAERELDHDDFEARLGVWNEIVAIAPATSEYVKARSTVQAEVDRLAPFREHPEDGAEITTIRPHRAAFGAMMTMDITIHNQSLSDLKDFEIACTNRGPSDTVIGNSATTLYEIVPARSTKTFRKVDMGFINPQTKSTKCIVERSAIH